MSGHKKTFILHYIKIFILALLALAAIVLAVQNQTFLAQEISFKLNLYFWEGLSVPYPLYMIILLVFLLGVLLTSLAGIGNRFYLRGQLKEAVRKNEEAEKEILSLRGLSLRNSGHGEGRGELI
ncbi:MAG: lipopolysaccharide assembly protein LapA domain-containing protein [Desulfarculales bacterium]|jgi:uncharacterized integral membrane protein|nr:lipopolysaccharide assembly protein LapA domain-containing protein [Desulfarculales bacterium]